MMSKVRRSAFIVFLLMVNVGVETTTAAAQGNRPRTQAVEGDINAHPVNVMQRMCTGEDGAYLELRGKWEGTITNSDERLNGRLEFMAEPALVQITAPFLGTFQGPFSIFDLETGMLKARGEFHSVVTEASKNHGFATGKVINHGGPADNFFASFKTTLTPPPGLLVSGQFGRFDLDNRTPAVIQGGTCTGPFTRITPP